jgi:hypothetical protein
VPSVEERLISLEDWKRSVELQRKHVWSRVIEIGKAQADYNLVILRVLLIAAFGVLIGTTGVLLAVVLR